jgi:hypothetical protein
MSHLRRAVILLGLVLLLTGPAPSADEEPQPLALRIYDISALTMGRPEWRREHEPVGIDDVGDEDRPLFGSEGEEPQLPLGSAEELVELIRSEVAPQTWEELEGVDMATFGEGFLVAYTTPGVLTQIGVYLGTLERRIMQAVAVDIRILDMSVEQVAALRDGAPGHVLDAAKVAAVESTGTHGVDLGLLGHDGHPVTLYSGTQRAYLADYDVEVAEEAKISDPIVLVDNLGAVIQVRPVLSGDGGECVLRINGFLADPEEMRSVPAGEQNRLIEVPATKLAQIDAELELPVDSWALVDVLPIPGTPRRWAILARVRSVASGDSRAPARGVDLIAPPRTTGGAIEARWFDVGALTRPIREWRGRQLNLTPSNFTPPEPPELREPQPIVYADALRDLMQLLIAPDGWSREGLGIEIRMNRMQVRSTAPALDAVADGLTALRKGLRVSIATEATLFALDEADARKMGLEAGAAFDPEVLATLAKLVSVGRAEVLGTGISRNIAGSRGGFESSRRVPYLSDYEVEIAKGAVISNPIINHLYSGTVLDLEAALTPSRGSVCAVLRFARSAVRQPLRRVHTPHGDLEVPEYDLFRSRATFVVPLGRSTVVSTARAGTRRHVLVLTSRAKLP